MVKLVDPHPTVKPLGLGYDGMISVKKRLPESTEHHGQREVELLHPVPASRVENDGFSGEPTLHRHGPIVADPQIWQQFELFIVGGSGRKRWEPFCY